MYIYINILYTSYRSHMCMFVFYMFGLAAKKVTVLLVNHARAETIKDTDRSYMDIHAKEF